MRAYHADVLMPELAAGHAEFCCTVHASSIHVALARVGERAEEFKGRKRVETVRVTLRLGAEVVPDVSLDALADGAEVASESGEGQ